MEIIAAMAILAPALLPVALGLGAPRSSSAASGMRHGDDAFLTPLAVVPRLIACIPSPALWSPTLIYR